MDKVVYFWSGYEPILRILVVGTLTYAGIIIILRVAGKRTLVNMNAFDFIITIAMGSAFGRILTAKKVSLSESLTTFLLLVLLQYLVASLQVRSKRFSRWLTSEPTLLFYKGKFLLRNIRKQRIRQKELLGAVRKERLKSLEQVEAIILESDGSFSVIKKAEVQDQLSFEGISKD